MDELPYFSGTLDQPKNTILDLPVFNPAKLTNPKDYLAGEELAAAVNVALTLGMPLLLTGEPGCGKSELARRIAWEIGASPIDPHNPKEQQLPDELKTRILKYVVKSTTEARDLFYTFDTVGRFHAAQTSRLLMEAKLVESARHSATPEQDDAQQTSELPKLDKPVEANNYIEYQALGLALLRAKGPSGSLPEGACSQTLLDSLPPKPQRSVVLIDEIDKAPRDVPNDILSEIENMEFTIPELRGIKIALTGEQQAFRPIVIITSNSERDLPPAFLRRCVYYHVPFPPFSANPENKDEKSPAGVQVTVENIVSSRFGKRFDQWPKLTTQALSFCQFLRTQQYPLVKSPSLAEVLNWLSYLATLLPDAKQTVPTAELELKNIEPSALLISIKGTLLKTKADQARASELWEGWLERPLDKTEQ